MKYHMKISLDGSGKTYQYEILDENDIEYLVGDGFSSPEEILSEIKTMGEYCTASVMNYGF